jgi:hypothetical protein
MVGQRIVLVTLAALVLVTVAPEANGGGGTPITTCGQTVTTNAVLTVNLSCTGNGVVVGASGITIDLKGFTIRGDGDSASDEGIDVSGGFDSVSVKNGVVRTFGNGVYANAADRLRVTGIVSSGNLSDGFSLSGASVSVTSSAAYGNGQVGIFVLGDHAQVKSSIGSGNNEGIQVIGDFAKVTSAQAVGNAFDGINIQGNSGVVKSSTASGNSFVGILVGEICCGTVPASVVSANKAYGNGFIDGVSDLSGRGIAVGFVSTPPVGRNVSRGNDNPDECDPASLC